MCLFGSCTKFVYWYADIRSVMVKNLVGIRSNSVVWRSENEESPVDELRILLFQEYYQPKLHALSGKSLKMTSNICIKFDPPPQKKWVPFADIPVLAAREYFQKTTAQGKGGISQVVAP